MKALKIVVIAVVIVAVGCITVNVKVSFPEAEMKQAATKIVEEVQQGTPPKPEAPTSAAPATAPHAMSHVPWSFISYSYVSADIDITVENAEINAIKARMQKNFTEYKPYKDNGSVGENLSGYLEERSDGSSKLAAADVKALRKLIQRENADRKALYLALLEANNIDASELPKIEEIFAASWYEKSQDTWYVRYKDPEKGLIWLTKAEWSKKPK